MRFAQNLLVIGAVLGAVATLFFSLDNDVPRDRVVLAPRPVANVAPENSSAAIEIPATAVLNDRAMPVAQTEQPVPVPVPVPVPAPPVLSTGLDGLPMKMSAISANSPVMQNIGEVAGRQWTPEQMQAAYAERDRIGNSIPEGAVTSIRNQIRPDGSTSKLPAVTGAGP